MNGDRAMQEVQIIGFAGEDAVLRYTPTGRPVCNVSFAVNNRYVVNGQERRETVWQDVTFWNGLAENAAKMIRKGRQVRITGDVTARGYINAKLLPANLQGLSDAQLVAAFNAAVAGSLEVRAETFLMLDPMPEDMRKPVESAVETPAQEPVVEQPAKSNGRRTRNTAPVTKNEIPF